MLEKHNWITPYFNYELRFDRPVFFYWLIAFAYKLFGVSEFSARFFSAVSATSIVAAVYAFGCAWVSSRYGLFSAVILATSILFVGIARMSITDMTLTAFMTLTTLCLFMAVHRNLRWWLAAGVFAGLGVLTKGPVALVVPGAIATLYAMLIGDWKRVLLNRWLPSALGITALIALPWYIAAYQQNGQIFLDALVLHNVTRFSDTVSGHKQPIYFYVIVLLAGFLPWTPYLPAALHRLREQAKAGHAAKVRAQDMSYLVALYSAVWVGFTFLFFTLSHTKLLTYILPLFPGLALLMAETWHARSLKPTQGVNKGWKWFTIPAWTMLGAGLIGGALFTFRMSALLPREAAGVTANGANAAAVFILLVGLLIAAWLLQRRSAAPALVAQAVTMLLVCIVAMRGIVPNVSNATQGVMMGYLQRTGGQPLMLYEIQRPSLTYYGRRRIPRYVEEDRPQLLGELNRHSHTFVITKNSQLASFQALLPAHLQVRVLEKDPVYSLLSVTPTGNPQP
jgi:4-amino-4-deoxy-L-arabinose transferase-like glycosyltransferase